MSRDVAPGRYRHFKDGEYQVVLVAKDVETEDPMVVHQALYGERGYWVRSRADFTAHVSRDVYEGPRFVRLPSWEPSWRTAVRCRAARFGIDQRGDPLRG